MKTRQEKLDTLKNLEKETQIHELLNDLLCSMGLQNVVVTHERGNKSEDGKDVICSYHNDIDNTDEWWAFVVKKGVIAGTSAVIQDIIAQIKECFSFEYKNSIKGIRIHINKVKVVTNDHFSSEAERKIRDAELVKDANIAFWDSEKLLELIEKYYPQYWVKGTKEYKKYVERFSDQIEVDTVSKTLGINNAKAKKIIDSAIEPKLVERVENSDGSFNWKQKSSNSIIQLSDNSIIIGEPGSGKSTFFKFLSKEIIEQNSLRNDVEFYPILLTFSDLKKTSFDIEKAVIKYFEQDWNIDLCIDGSYILKQGRCVLFIDALDELAQEELKEAALQSINSFYDKYPNIKIICSSRPSDYLFYNCQKLGFKYLEMAPIDRRQVAQFLDSYFSDNLIKSKKLLKSLKDTGILEKLPKTPMTIALITIIFDEKEVEIPATITDLYRQFVDLLIGKYTAENTIEIIEIGAKHRLLSYIGKYLHFNKKQQIEKETLVNLVRSYAEERGQELDAENIINDIISNTGLLFVNKENKIQFKHLSFQEYFTAYEIFHRNQEERTLFVNAFNDPWWQNVAIFYAGMTKDSPKLIDEILQASRPANFQQSVFNTLGIGKLLQALYNSPISDRIKGIERSLDNTILCINDICEVDDGSTKLWRGFSKYNLMQIFGGVFSFSHWSVTLVNPLKQTFSNIISQFSENRSNQEQFELEFKLFLICTILSSEEFASFGEFRQLVENTKSPDLSLFALEDMYIRKLYPRLSDTYKKSEEFIKIKRLIERRRGQLGDISKYVNAPVSDIKLMEKKENTISLDI